MGTSGNSDCQWASKSVLKDFHEDALTIPAGSLLNNGTARIVKAIGDGAYSISVGGTCRCGRVALGEGGRHGEFQEAMGNLEHGN